MEMDLGCRRLFVAESENDSVAIIDPNEDKVIRIILNMNGPQGWATCYRATGRQMAVWNVTNGIEPRSSEHAAAAFLANGNGQRAANALPCAPSLLAASGFFVNLGHHSVVLAHHTAY